jgi:dihydroorotase
VGLLLKNGRVIDPADGLDAALDVLLDEGRVAARERGLAPGDHEVLDVSNLVVCPGFIDVHVHLREPGQEYKETIASGARAAAAGGFTRVCCMPNTEPAIDEPSVVRLIDDRAAEGCGVRIHAFGALSKANEGKELAELGRLADAGCPLFSDDAFPIQSSELMRHAMEYARMLGRGVSLHCEDKSLAGAGVMNEGSMSTRLGLRGIPNAAEDVMVARNIELARLTAVRLHICHVSTAGAVELVRRAKKEGLPVTAEACPHHFCLTDAACEGYNTDAKVNPPLRTQADMDAVLGGLQDGTLDCIATDHAPHAIQEKECEFDRALFGMIGLETAVPLALDRLVRAEIISLAEMIAKLSIYPARVLQGSGRAGLDPLLGTLRKGAPADVTVLNLSRSYRVEPQRLHSKSRNTPFAGWELTGAPVGTIAGGRRLMWDGELVEA